MRSSSRRRGDTRLAIPPWRGHRRVPHFSPTRFPPPAPNPPVPWPPQIPTFVLNLIPPPGLPSLFSYQNLGTVNDKGIELGVDGVVNRYLNVNVNYSYQADPDIEGFDPSETNFPANNRFNAGFNFNYRRLLGNFMVSYTGGAYWQDV